MTAPNDRDGLFDHIEPPRDAVPGSSAEPPAEPAVTPVIGHPEPVSAVTGQARHELGPLWREWPLLSCLVIFTAGIVVAGAGHWRRGAVLMGAAAVLAGVLRLVLPPKVAGLLQVRRRWFDVLAMLLGGIVMCVLSILVPPQQG